MPVKEIMAWTSLALGGWYMTGDYSGMMIKIRKAQIAILRDVARTDNWGNPSLWRSQRKPGYTRKRVTHEVHK